MKLVKPLLIAARKSKEASALKSDACANQVTPGMEQPAGSLVYLFEHKIEWRFKRFFAL